MVVQKDEQGNPFVQVPLGDFVDDIATKAAERVAERVIKQHVNTCPNAVSFKVWRAKVTGTVAGVFIVMQILWAVGSWAIGLLMK